MSTAVLRAQSDIDSASQYGFRSVKNRFQINHFILPTFTLSVIGLACLWALWYYLSFTSVFPYHQRVFHCKEVRLYKPNFRPEDFQVYISYTLLYTLGFTLPPTVILIGEIMFWMFSTRPRKMIYANCGECKIHLISRRLIRFISVFMFGALITQIFVYTIKLMTGFQRPYFLSLCNVDLSKCVAPLEQSPSPSPALACFNHNSEDLRYASLSFPSLHAAFSSFSSIFASCYIYYMINLRGAPLLRPFLISGFLGLTLVDSFSRINGYKNHWEDVLFGWLLGFFIAFFLCHSVLCFQEIYRIKIEKPLTPEERISPFFSWFKLPRVRAPSLREEYVVYEEDLPQQEQVATRRKRGPDRTYEVTTTTESFHRTVVPPSQRQNGQKY